MSLSTNRLPTTPDLLSERLTRLRSDFPDLFTAEWSLDMDAIKTITSEKPDHREHYRFEWAGKHESKRLAFTPSTARLQFDESRSVNPDNAKGNMIIEWDNLEVLKLLTSAYRGAVKCIYIDPPYNTGKDFVYSDNYTEWRTAYWDKSWQVEDGVRIDTNSESAGRYHSDWLSMMHSRLLLARGLLKDDWVIFVSIDDHEVHNLRKLMDEVFGEENFITQMVWKKRTGSNDSQNLSSTDHEYVICYWKGDIVSFTWVKKEFENYKNPDNDPLWDWMKDNLTCNKTASERPNLFYQIIDPKNGRIFECNINRVWAYEKSRMEQIIKEGKVIFPKDISWTPMYKRHRAEVRSDVQPFSSIIETTINAQATKELRDILGWQFFDYPKSADFIKQLINQGDNTKEWIILDFFAWSGTTGQAVMELNREDGGNRQYILVQLPELTDEKSEAYKAGYKRISDITIERNKRVIERMEEKKNTEQKSSVLSDTSLAKGGLGFRVLTLARSAFPRVDFISDPDRTEEENLALLEDYITRKEAVFNLETHVPGVMEEVLLKNGFRLDYTLTPVTEITTNLVYLASDSTGLSAYITLDRPIRSETISYFQSHTDQRFICLEQSLDTTAKWNLRTALGDLFVAY